MRLWCLFMVVSLLPVGSVVAEETSTLHNSGEVPISPADSIFDEDNVTRVKIGTANQSHNLGANESVTLSSCIIHGPRALSEQVSNYQAVVYSQEP